MAALGINLGYLFVQIFNFAILFVVLRAWVFKPIIRVLDQRRQTIAQALEDARIAAEARANAEKDAQAILAKAQQEASQRVREASERAEKVALEIKAEAEHEAEAIREAAAAEAKQAKVAQLGELRGQVAALAVAAAQKLIGEALDEKRQHALIDEFFSGVRGGKVTVLEGASATGASAEVTTALPLSETEQAAVKRDVLSKLGGSATTSFLVDPSILGGMVVCVGDKVLDGSVAGKLENLRQTLK